MSCSVSPRLGTRPYGAHFMTRPDPSSIDAAKARYETERAKRLRDEGLAQYETLSEHHLDRDPWADPDFARDPITEEVDVVVLGGGWAGMLTGINLVKRGITNFRILDKAADFGGTWYWNRYPGCMCDVDATIYLPLLEETGYMPTEKYASATEIFGYCQLLGTPLRALRARAVPDRGRVAHLGRRRAPLGRGDQAGRPHPHAVLRLGRWPDAQGQAARHRRHRPLRRQSVPHDPLGLRVHRRQPDRADGPSRRQGRRHHRHRRDVGAGRAAARPVGEGGLRLPAHAVGRRGARPAADRRGLVPLAPLRVGRPSAPATSPRW